MCGEDFEGGGAVGERAGGEADKGEGEDIGEERRTLVSSASTPRVLFVTVVLVAGGRGAGTLYTLDEVKTA